MNREDLSIELAIPLGQEFSVTKTVNFNQLGLTGGILVNRFFNEAYNYKIIDIRFFSCMN